MLRIHNDIMLKVSMKSKCILFTFLKHIAGLILHYLFYKSKEGCKWRFMLALSFSQGFYICFYICVC